MSSEQVALCVKGPHSLHRTQSYNNQGEKLLMHELVSQVISKLYIPRVFLIDTLSFAQMLSFPFKWLWHAHQQPGWNAKEDRMKSNLCMLFTSLWCWKKKEISSLKYFDWVLRWRNSSICAESITLLADVYHKPLDARWHVQRSWNNITSHAYFDNRHLSLVSMEGSAWIIVVGCCFHFESLQQATKIQCNWLKRSKLLIAMQLCTGFRSFALSSQIISLWLMCT
jgi:hypothetical protein